MHLSVDRNLNPDGTPETPVIAPTPQTSRRKAKRSRTQPPRPVPDEALAAEKWAQMDDLERRVTDIQDAEVLAMLNLFQLEPLKEPP